MSVEFRLEAGSSSNRRSGLSVCFGQLKLTGFFCCFIAIKGSS